MSTEYRHDFFVCSLAIEEVEVICFRFGVELGEFYVDYFSFGGSDEPLAVASWGVVVRAAAEDRIRPVICDCLKRYSSYRGM